MLPPYQLLRILKSFQHQGLQIQFLLSGLIQSAWLLHLSVQPIATEEFRVTNNFSKSVFRHISNERVLLSTQSVSPFKVSIASFETIYKCSICINNS